jgi:hypothetical protein
MTIEQDLREERDIYKREVCTLEQMMEGYKTQRDSLRTEVERLREAIEDMLRDLYRGHIEWPIKNGEQALRETNDV